MWNSVVLLFLAVSVCYSAPPKLAKNDPEGEGGLGHMVTIEEGGVCNVQQLPKPDPTFKHFFTCLKPTQDPFNWPWADTGVWTRVTCPKGKLFSAEHMRCKPSRTVRRQQANYCAAYPQSCAQAVNMCVSSPCGQQQVVQPVMMPVQTIQPVVQPVQPVQPVTPVVNPAGQWPAQTPQPVVNPAQQFPQPVVAMPCPLVQGGSPASSGQVGQTCSWMLDPLVPASSPKAFLQCAPKSPGLYCGKWVNMPCAPATKFDASLQVCVHDETASTGTGGWNQGQQPIQPVVNPAFVSPTPAPVYPPYQQPITQPTTNNACGIGFASIGQCNNYNQCPGFSVCLQSTCCQRRKSLD